MKKFSSILLILGFLILCSCSENTTIDKYPTEPTYGKDFTVSGIVYNQGRSEELTIEASGRIHRPKRGCDYGFGLCNWSIKVSLREDGDYWHFTSSLVPMTTGRSTAAVEYYFDVILDYPLEEEFDSNFYIDDPIASEEYSLVPGVYQIDMSMGEFGGYRIPVIKN